MQYFDNFSPWSDHYSHRIYIGIEILKRAIRWYNKMTLTRGLVKSYKRNTWDTYDAALIYRCLILYRNLINLNTLCLIYNKRIAGITTKMLYHWNQRITRWQPWKLIAWKSSLHGLTCWKFWSLWWRMQLFSSVILIWMRHHHYHSSSFTSLSVET